MSARFVYEHPAEAGFGEHHADPADPPLAERPAQVLGIPPPEYLAFLDLTPEQQQKLRDAHDLTMADLDMPHGTQVQLATDTDPESPGFGGPLAFAGGEPVIIEWADAWGHPRRTSLAPEFFREHFREVTE